MLVLLVVLAVADVAVVSFVAKNQSSFDHSESAIVLGAAINTPALKNRTLTALNLYKEHKVDSLVLSGGKVAASDISEAQYMEQVIKYYQDEPVNYIMEDKSTSTYENLKNSREKIPEVESVVIVSDEYHLARAVIMAKRLGFETVYWKAPKPTYYTRAELRFYYFREFVAMVSYIPKFIFG